MATLAGTVNAQTLTAGETQDSALQLTSVHSLQQQEILGTHLEK